MNFTALGSSSAGNAYILDDGENRLLMECGFPFKKLKRLAGFDIGSLCGCVVTHEHSDHARSWREIVKAGIPLWMTAGTARTLGAEAVNTFAPLEGPGRHYRSEAVGNFEIKPFATLHDATEPVGFLVRSKRDGERLLFATDTVRLTAFADRISLLALECNYDEALLSQCSRLPAKVSKRIRNNHMEMGTVMDYLKRADLSCCRRIYLLHLSNACSDAQVMVGMAEYVTGVPVEACPKEGKAVNR